VKLLVELVEDKIRGKIVWMLHEIINMTKIYGHVAPENEDDYDKQRKDAKKFCEDVLDNMKALLECYKTS
jgi:hypothetical protein